MRARSPVERLDRSLDAAVAAAAAATVATASAATHFRPHRDALIRSAPKFMKEARPSVRLASYPLRCTMPTVVRRSDGGQRIVMEMYRMCGVGARD